MPKIIITIEVITTGTLYFLSNWLYDPCGGISFDVKRIQRMVLLPANSRGKWFTFPSIEYQITHLYMYINHGWPPRMSISHALAHRLVKRTWYARECKTGNKQYFFIKHLQKYTSFLQSSWIDIHNHSNVNKLNIDISNMKLSLYQAFGCSGFFQRKHQVS